MKNSHLVHQTRPLQDVADEMYYLYGVSVIEDRAIFADDGLKPVTRKTLWAAHKMGLRATSKADKSAKVVGDVIGNYHPHGDTGTYAAIVTAAKSPQRMFSGEGNFGTMNDNAAAMRYTNVRLSLYSELVFFDKFYLPTTVMVPNYDGSTTEPLLLPTLLPNHLLNGNFGIAPGVNTRSPSYSLASVIALIKRVLMRGKPCTAKQCLKLEFTTKYGGEAVRTADVDVALLEFYRTGKGSVRFMSTYETLSDGSVRFFKFAPISSVAKTLATVDGIKGVARTADDSNKKDPHQVAYTVSFVKSCTGKDKAAVLKKVESAFSAQVKFSVQITKRYRRDDGTSGAKLAPSTVPMLVNEWIATRIELEVEACTYWSGEIRANIADLELLRLAVAQRDVILKALARKDSDEQLAAYLSKALKITVAQANRILDLKVRQLRSLEDTVLRDKIKENSVRLKEMAARTKDPVSYILRHLDVLGAKLVP